MAAVEWLRQSFLRTKGARLTVSDCRGRGELGPEIQTLESLGIRCEAGGHRPATFLEAECIVVSPAFPWSSRS